MKKFFENYGAVALGILALIVLIAMITPVGNIVKTSLQGTVQTFSTSIESQSNAIDFVTIDSGTRIKIGDKHYIILEKMGLTSFKVLDLNTTSNINFNSANSDGNIYENSYIDNYLETVYYNSLPQNIRNAIVSTNIKQAFYTKNGSNPKMTSWGYKPGTSSGTSSVWYNEGSEEEPNWVIYHAHIPQDGDEGTYPYRLWSKYETGPNEYVPAEISRKVFLPSVEELLKIADLNSQKDVKWLTTSLEGLEIYLWTRDGSKSNNGLALYISPTRRSLNTHSLVNTDTSARPAYTLDLSKINFEIE